MSEKEITMEQFTNITGLANPSSSFTGVVNGPVQMVNWYHALVFCNKLSMKEGLTPVYSISGSANPAVWGAVPMTNDANWNAAAANWSANGYRLPTEMEYMWTAMGADTANAGQVNTNGYLKPFAGSTGVNLVGDYAWTYENSGNTTHPVGTRLANKLGLYDMSGNVWEWCWDRYASYPTGAQTDYRGAASDSSGAGRVLRGGSWGSLATNAAVANRVSDIPYGQFNTFGFRVVRP